jgi:predicted outer membrane repeat protein
MDRYDNRSYKSGVSLTYSVPNTGATGSFSSSLPVITDTNGLATLPKLTANSRTGYYKISVVAPSLLAGYLDIRVGNGLNSPISVTNTYDSGTGSLRDAIRIASSEPGDDKIIFTGNSFNANANITLNSTLYINDTSGKVSITGTGMKSLVISGNNKYTVFSVNSPTALANLSIDSGNFSTSYWSGGINSYSGLYLSNISITNCRGDIGGAVYSGFDLLYRSPQVSLPLSITDCVFSNNTASTGGAIFRNTLSDELGIISNSTFSYNYGSFGGAIYNAESQLLANNCLFTDNYSNYGGAIMNSSRQRTSSVVLNSSIFSRNSSRSFGGTIYNEVSGSSFMGITTNGMTSISISDSTISNSTSMDGGSIYNFSGGSPLTSYANITLLNSKILNSQATNKGGIIYNMFYSNTSGVLVIDNSTLANSSSGSGGAIFNQAINGIQGFLTNITNSSFLFNSASLQGGAITNLDNSIVNISKSTFAYNNSANGGVIYNDMTYPNLIPILNLDSGTFAYNSADHGGAVFNAAGNITILNSIVANNTSSDGPDIKGNISTANFSLIGDPSQANILQSSQTIFGNPKLGNLGSYGGPTQTIPILLDSPAVNHASSNIVGTTDQRGKIYATSDMGAFASQKFDTVCTLSGDTSSAFGYVANFTVHVNASLNIGVSPTGIVQFYDGTMLLGIVALDPNGTATLSTRLLTVGQHLITVSYAGDTNYSSSTTFRMPMQLINLGTLAGDTAS